ncbi:MAG: RAP domain-containing protein [Planctomycetota bacterium]
MSKPSGSAGNQAINQAMHCCRWSAAALALSIICIWPTLARAGTQSYDRITVSVEPPTSATSNYGYAVYRMTVSNRSNTPRTVTVTMPAESWHYGDSIGRLSRTVRVEPNSTADTELLQPALPMSGSDARVSIDGQAQREWVPVTLANHSDGYDGQPILASRGVGGAVNTSFETAMTAIAEAKNVSSSGSIGGYPGGGYGYTNRLARMFRAPRPVSEWSGNWLAYSRYMAVMLSEDELRDAPLSVDAALRDYVAGGGLLVVLGEGDRMPGLGPAWTQAATSDGQTQGGNASWLEIGLGELELSAANNLAQYNTDDWERWVDRSVQKSRLRFTRLDASGAEGRLPMLETLKVPTRGLLGMMLLFTLLIGPGNILLLSWLKRRMWLLWTIPVIAFAFAGAVLVYSILSEGIKPRAKTVAVTLLDQNTRQAVTVGMTGYYAPLTPGDGLRFGDRTQLTPQNGDSSYYRNSGRPRSLDVTNGQHLSRGWIVARVPAHFDLRTVESRRERLEISRDAEGGLSVVNGLGLPIKQLLVADAEGQRYEVGPLRAGDASPLKSLPKGWPSAQAHAAVTDQGWSAVSSINRDPEDYLQPGRYIAILDNASFAEPGLAGLGEHETTGIVIGRWEGAE